MSLKPIPEALPVITPHLVVGDAPRAIDFYAAALDAREIYRMPGPDGVRLLFSELMIGDARLFVVDEFPEQGALSPLALGGSPVVLHLYVADVDAAYRRAVDAGMTVDLPLADFFWGERYALLRDPFGHRWGLASRIEDLSPSQIRERAIAFYGKNRA